MHRIIAAVHSPPQQLIPVVQYLRPNVNKPVVRNPITHIQNRLYSRGIGQLLCNVRKLLPVLLHSPLLLDGTDQGEAVDPEGADPSLGCHIAEDDEVAANVVHAEKGVSGDGVEELEGLDGRGGLEDDDFAPRLR